VILCGAVSALSGTGLEGFGGRKLCACVRGAAVCCILILIRGVSSIILYVYNIPYYVHDRIEYSNFLLCFVHSYTFLCGVVSIGPYSCALCGRQSKAYVWSVYWCL
jgi:uncharacterized membrane protein